MAADGFRRARAAWPAEIARDVDEELASHLAEREEEYAACGMARDEAAAAAARRFGNRDDVADACRRIDRRLHLQERRAGMLTDLRQDLGYALRLFRRSRGFAVTAILTLALGIGATTAIFTLANWALLRPVPGVDDPANVSVFWVGRRAQDSFTPARLSYPNLADAVARVKTMTLGAYQGGGTVPVAANGQAARPTDTQYVDAGYFTTLGVAMQIGRPFTAAEDRPPSPLLGAVISDRLWQSMFQRSPEVLQQTLQIAGVRFAILGVTPRGFHGSERISLTDLWLPGAATGIVRHMNLRSDARGSGGYFELVARLQPGATWKSAQAELEALRAWLRDEYPEDNGKFQQVGFHLMGPIGPPPFGRDAMMRVIGLAAGAASALVLLIACANVAGLLLVRGVERRGEVGIRKALGASRWRLVRQHVGEGLLLWAAGGALAVAGVLLLAGPLTPASLLGFSTLSLDLSIDWRVMAFSAGVSLFVGLLSSLGPALRATRVEAVDTLRAAGLAATRRSRAGHVLAVLQLGAALTLLIGAYLLTSTLLHLWRVPLGFDPAHVFAMPLEPTSIGYSEAAALEYLDEFQRRLAAVPGVRGVSAANAAPFVGGINMMRDVVAAGAPAETPAVHVLQNSVFSSTYFKTTAIPIVEGRPFNDGEIIAGRRGEAHVVILSQNLARHLFGTVTPIGRAIEFPRQRGSGERYQVIGVAAAARYGSLVTPPDEMFYEPAGPRSVGILSGATLIVRTDGSVPLAARAAAIAAALNPSLPLAAVVPMSEAVAHARAEWESLAVIIGMLTSIATLLACVGLYGVVAHAVAERRRELGIRIALGATRAQVWQLVLRRAAMITAAGIALGLAGGAAFTRVIGTRLVGVSPNDPVVWTLAALSLAAVAVLASAGPARAAVRVDVNETLRAL